VRVLPRAAFGAQAMSDGLGPDAPDVVVLHHFMGSGRAGRRRWALGWLGAWLRLGGARFGAAGGGGGGGGADLAGLPEAGERGPEGVEREGEEGLARRAAAELYPVSVSWEPPFTMLVDLAGAGDVQARRGIRLTHDRLCCSAPAGASLSCQPCRRRGGFYASRGRRVPAVLRTPAAWPQSGP